MKLAIVYHHRNLGGGSRFFECLINALCKNHLFIAVHLFISNDLMQDKRFKTIINEFSNIKICSLQFEKNKHLAFRRFLKKIPFLGKRYKILLKFLGMNISSGLTEKTIAEINNCDVIYLPWPYFLNPFEIKIPLIATFHDFNYKHKFGNFFKREALMIDKQMTFWLKKCLIAIVSSESIAVELKNFYPFASQKIKIIYLSSFVLKQDFKINTKTIINKYKLPHEYILYPANTAFHKNHINLFKALSILKKEKKNPPLILVGMDTNLIEGLLNFKNKITIQYFRRRRLIKLIKKSNLIIGKDFYVLGYVKDEEVNAFIKEAKLVISVSLYEAGSGPALDAWKIGSSVAFSNISSHLDQLKFFKNEAWTFNPKDPKDIAMVIKKAILEEKDKSLEMIKVSQKKINKYSWKEIAKEYYQCFEKAQNQKVE